MNELGVITNVAHIYEDAICVTFHDGREYVINLGPLRNSKRRIRATKVKAYLQVAK